MGIDRVSVFWQKNHSKVLLKCGKLPEFSKNELFIFMQVFSKILPKFLLPS